MKEENYKVPVGEALNEFIEACEKRKRILEELEKRGCVERVKMIEHTKICKLDERGYPVHLTDLDGLIPNVFVGMQMQVKSTMYKVKEILAVVDKNFCRQIIKVEEL